MTEYSFIVNEQETNLIIGVLREQPFKIVAPLIQKIEKQIEKQKNEREIMHLIGGAPKVD